MLRTAPAQQGNNATWRSLSPYIQSYSPNYRGGVLGNADPSTSLAQQGPLGHLAPHARLSVTSAAPLPRRTPSKVTTAGASLLVIRGVRPGDRATLRQRDSYRSDFGSGSDRSIDTPLVHQCNGVRAGSPGDVRRRNSVFRRVVYSSERSRIQGLGFTRQRSLIRNQHRPLRLRKTNGLLYDGDTPGLLRAPSGSTLASKR